MNYIASWAGADNPMGKFQATIEAFTTLLL